METLRVYKFIIQPVLQVLDEEGTVVAERSPQQPDVAFGIDGVHRYAETFEQNIAAAVAAAISANNGKGE